MNETLRPERKLVFLVDTKQYTELHAQCGVAMKAYFAQAEKSCGMLGNCSASPLPFLERLAIMRQEITEKNAQLVYMSAKRLLHRAALLGFEAVW
jgi:hypothetical protein